MAESSTQIPSPPNVTPKEEPITLYRPKSPNPFLPIDQVAFNFDEMLFTTNNEVGRIYPDHPNSYGVRGEIGVTTFRNAIGAHYSDEYVDSPSLAIVEIIDGVDYSVSRRFISLLLDYIEPEYANESLTINPTQVFSVNNWALKPNQPEEPLFTKHMLAVCKTTMSNVPKALKPFSNVERVPQGIKPGAKPGHNKHSTSST
ncbi:hypothetical protein Tco_0200063 [Tanacetum coccineum]